ncbi:MAG: branched-chain amino acid ABC transporter substrate-binding protein [Actinomycetota bacterium]
MLDRRILRAVAPVAIICLGLSACGSKKKESGSGKGGTTVKIAFIAPLSGSLTALGVGMKNSVKLAIDQANTKGTVKGFTIELDAQDDTGKADVGGQVAAKVASDAAVAGVVGTLNSSVALQAAPILDKQHIVMISPANTAIGLTGRDKIDAQVRPYANYFRVATTDDIQGPFAANYVSKDLHLTKVAVIHDKKAYGQGLAAAFTKQFEANGGKVVSQETVNPGDKDFSSVLSKIKPTGPELIYYGGEYPEMSLLSSQAKPLGLKIPLMGGDGVYDPTYITVAKDAAEGDLATSVGAATEKLDSAKQFVTDYAAAKFADPYSAYGAQAYDAANVIINAMAKALKGKKTLDAAGRQAIIDEVQKTDFSGVTGKVAFDKFGDTTTKLLTVYKVTSGKWNPEKSGEFS